jgi:indolepyruvate ferredoxin oxidoreductase alpha subunit
MFRTTTRVAHSQSIVELGERANFELKEYSKTPSKYVMMPAMAKARHIVVEERLEKLAAYAETSPINKIEYKDKKIGVITNGIAYEYAKEALPDASILKLGMTFPLPKQLITDFINACDEVFVLEELEAFIEDQIKTWGLKVKGKELFSFMGEYSSAEIAEKIAGIKHLEIPCEAVPARPPVMCPGCPHRGVFYILNKLKLHVAGDIGCYTLGALPPLVAIDTCICMGASIGTALGMEKARGKEFARKLVAVIGDSTFMHSGVTGLMDVVYNQGTTTTIILDNSITAMTGHQHNPSTGQTLQGKATQAVNIPALVRALGIERVVTVDPNNLIELQRVIKEEVAADEPSVIITKSPCVLIVKNITPELYTVDQEKCIGCKGCLRIGCPAIAFSTKKAHIDDTLCVGCGLCPQVCPSQAMVKAGGENA